jgi:hypothetical protein
MRVAFSILLSIFSFALFSNVCAQQNALNKTREPIRLIKSKPSVYITFECNGRIEPLKSGESNERIWLRLHNNTRWEISFCTFGVPEAYGEVGMYYEVERSTFQESGFGDNSQKVRDNTTKKEIPELPIGYRSHFCSVFRLSPGEEAVFSVPREHLVENLSVRIAFNYGWEDTKNIIISGREPAHNVYFFAADMPSNKDKKYPCDRNLTTTKNK